MPIQKVYATLASELYHKVARLLGETLPGPTLTFGFIFATLLGALFHLLLGGDVRRLALFLLAGWLGFALGHVAGVTFGVGLFSVGALRLLPAVIGALTLLILAHALTSRPARRRINR